MGRKVVNRVGEKYMTYEGYESEILESFNAQNNTIKINDEHGAILYNRAFKEIKNGQIKNPYHRSVYGVGFSGQGKHKVSLNRIITKCGNRWRKILERCYDEKALIKRPSYIKCEVDERWHNFQNFAEWFENNYNYETMQDWQVDKDILIKGNKVYSPKTCCLVPAEINNLFIKNDVNRGDLPIGVQKEGKRYRAAMKDHYIGTFDTIEEAFQAYKVVKEVKIKQTADRWQSYIEPRVYDAMYAYKVEITD